MLFFLYICRMEYTDPLEILYDQVFTSDIDDDGLTDLMKRALDNADSNNNENEEILIAGLVIHFDIIPWTAFSAIDEYIKKSNFSNLYIRESYTQYILGGGKFCDNIMKSLIISMVQKMGATITETTSAE